MQLTAIDFTQTLEQAGIRISMDGRGRALDNILVERLWRTVKYENVYLMEYAIVPDLITGLTAYFEFYNYERLHQSLGYRNPSKCVWRPRHDGDALMKCEAGEVEYAVCASQ